MSKTFAIQLKAAFLLFIFSLNMFVGFACSIGVNAGESKAHHHKEVATTNNHAHKHEHNKTAKSHLHPEKKSHNHQTDHKDAKDKKGCCNDEVQKVQQLDKYVSSNAKMIAVDVLADINQNQYQPYSITFTKTNLVKLRERFFYPPPPNILLNIQRFQI